MSEKIKKAIEDARRDALRMKQRHEYSTCKYLAEVNDPTECVILLKKINDAVHTLYTLSDTDYYLDNIWNAGTDTTKQLADVGITEEWLMETAEKLEQIRTILFGTSLDFDELYKTLYDDLLCYEAYWNRWHEEAWKKEFRLREKAEKEAKK